MRASPRSRDVGVHHPWSRITAHAQMGPTERPPSVKCRVATVRAGVTGVALRTRRRFGWRWMTCGRVPRGTAECGIVRNGRCVSITVQPGLRTPCGADGCGSVRAFHVDPVARTIHAWCDPRAWRGDRPNPDIAPVAGVGDHQRHHDERAGHPACTVRADARGATTCGRTAAPLRRASAGFRSVVELGFVHRLPALSASQAKATTRPAFPCTACPFLVGLGPGLRRAEFSIMCWGVSAARAMPPLRFVALTATPQRSRGTQYLSNVSRGTFHVKHAGPRGV